MTARPRRDGDGETAMLPDTAWFDSFDNMCSDTFFSLYSVSQ